MAWLPPIEYANIEREEQHEFLCDAACPVSWCAVAFLTILQCLWSFRLFGLVRESTSGNAMFPDIIGWAGVLLGGLLITAMGVLIIVLTVLDKRAENRESRLARFCIGVVGVLSPVGLGWLIAILAT